MIKKLRRTFIAVAMAVISVILAVVLTALNVTNWVSTANIANETLEVLKDNLYSPAENEGADKDPFETLNVAVHSQFYYIRFYVDSDEVMIRSSMTSEIDVGEEENVLTYATEVYNSGKADGWSNNYRYDSVTVDGGVIYIFLDCHESLSAFYNFLWYSILIAVVGLLATFVMVFFLSKLAIRPFIRNYENQKQFITDAGHELRTPLAIIQANTELLECDIGETEETVAIKNSVTRLNHMTTSLIYLSKMEEGANQYDMKDFNYSDEAMDIAEQFIPLVASKGKQLEIDIDPGITVHGDVKSLKELVSVFLDNAIKYCAPEGTITLSLKQDGKKAVLKVSNPTVDVPQGDHSEYFDRFYRADSSRSQSTSGHGIGLSIAMAIAENHKAELTAVSPDGEHIEFTFTL